METDSRRIFPCLAFFLTAGILIALACGVAATLGTGAFFWLTQRTTQRSEPAAIQSPSITISQDAVLVPSRGLVEFKRKAGSWTVVDGETAVSQGDQIRTGALSGAQVIFQDGSRTSLGSDTTIALKELDFQSGNRIVALSQSIGESRHEVAPSGAENSTYSVHTPGGSGEARSTIFQVMITPDRTAHFTVEDGSVAVTGLEETVVVETGQVSTIYADEPPTEPALRISGEGTVTQTGDTWIIAGQSFSIHENTFIIGSPQIGDLVHVEGRLLADNTRLADLIVLLRASPANQFTLTGLVEAMEDETWTVAGQDIEIGGSDEIDPGIQVGGQVRVEGVILEGGALQAERIVLYDEDGRLPFEFSGVVLATGAQSWTISGIAVAVDGNTTIEGGLAAGDIVRVHGWIQTDGTWLASQIRLAVAGERTFEIAGVLENIDPWRVAGISFETREWTEIDPELETGDLVRVEGRVQEDGTWIVYEIERIQDAPYPIIVIIGTVISTDPWVVSGIPLNVTPETIIEGDIAPGMLVRVEIYLLPDGTWQVIRITSLDVFIGIPGCLNLTATVISFDGTRLRLLGWPELVLGEDVEIDGELRPNSIIVIQLCFNEDGTFVIIQIIIIFQPEIDIEPPPTEGHKVTICHKPQKKKGGNTITIAKSALPAHLAHGDYIGACSR